MNYNKKTIPTPSGYTPTVRLKRTMTFYRLPAAHGPNSSSNHIFSVFSCILEFLWIEKTKTVKAALHWKK